MITMMHVKNQSTLEARFLSCSTKNLFLIRNDLGVISTNSSSSINSTAYSKLIKTGGTYLTASSVPEDLTLVNCFPFIGFTTKSLSRLLIPITIPSYNLSPGWTNIRPRS